MKRAFSKILIPVDFSLGTETAIKKAIGLIEPLNGEIHLLHVARPRRGPEGKFIIWETEKKLTEWARSIEEKSKDIKVSSMILPGTRISQTIIRAATLLSPDLIIIGKQGRPGGWSFHRAVSPDHIATESNCPVLTAKPGSMNSLTKIIVLPVGNFMPERKLELAVLIAKKCKAQVHLLSIRDEKEDNPALTKSFLNTYHQLREELHQPVEYYPISGNSTAKAALKYAESVMADIILLNPETESGILGITRSRHISDLIGTDSKIQVLDVQPYQQP